MTWGWPRFRIVVLVVVLGLLAIAVAKLRVSRPPPDPVALGARRATSSFALRSDLGPAELEHRARVLEAFRGWFGERYFEVPAGPPLAVYWFRDRHGYGRYARQFKSDFSPFGFYVRDARVVVLNEPAGLGTALHEVVHHFVAERFSRPPPEWVNEGFAAFFEKALGHFERDGTLTLTVGYFNPWRFESTKKRVGELDLRRLVGREPVDQSAARSVMLFLHDKKRLAPFIRRLLQAPDDRDGLVSLAEVWGAPVEEFEAEWKRFIATQPIDENVKLLPQSFVKTPEEWDAWWAENQSRIELDARQERYRARAPAAAARPE